MEYQEAKQRFIQEWGILGSSWGINRAMAQIHALLLISPEPLSTDEIMEELNISRGNANMNIRALIDWGIVFKEIRPGERKEYFYSKKDIWALAKQILKERRKNELEPVVRMLNEIKDVKKTNDAEVKEFKQVTEDIGKFVKKTDLMMEKFIQAEESWFFGTFLKLFK